MYSADRIEDAEGELAVALYALERGDKSQAIGRTIDAAQSLAREVKQLRDALKEASHAV